MKYFKYSIIAIILLFVSDRLMAQRPVCDGNYTIKPQDGGTTFLSGEPPSVPDASNTNGGPLFEGDRLVFWVHGLGGNIGSWERAATATTSQALTAPIPGYRPREVTSVFPSYVNQQSALESAGNTLRELFDSGNTASNQNVPKGRNIIIAHSQGGIVSRAADMQNLFYAPNAQRPYGGIVTFGTPHQGARILNNKTKYGDLLSSGCKALVKPQVNEILLDIRLVRNLIGGYVQDGLEALCNTFGSSVVTKTLLSDFNVGITEDYEVGATVLGTLNAFQTPAGALNIPKVAFYGVEDEVNTSWRVLSSLEIKTPNQYPPFGADDDSQMVTVANDAIMDYKAKYEAYRDAIIRKESRFPYFQASDWLKTKRDDWGRGLDWLLNFDDSFKTITGALTIIDKPERCLCNDGTILNAPHPDCKESYCRVRLPAEFSKTYKPSDGIILQESAQNFPGAIFNWKMLGSNHQQMRNDSNTKTALNMLFRGECNYLGGGIFFKTAERP